VRRSSVAALAMASIDNHTFLGLRASMRFRRFGRGELRKTALAFLSGALGIVCVSNVSHADLRDREIVVSKNVRASRSLR
jgi:hypothetical protein